MIHHQTTAGCPQMNAWMYDAVSIIWSFLAVCVILAGVLRDAEYCPDLLSLLAGVNADTYVDSA